ncbi:hypothetical protein Aspvir_010056 [Aspergillus viridinutans]|uniref:Uncharacterized protein n=1 Tax=Aspergillus viridinutans TaxID=75553 RepID=A0A9P3C6A1_ASPVI|nr:uncharacterized protein Aspvir_010056 [Aspergillus viridinutans]GIK05941.1 hypothetical protein Aspvir_010056 [Aspergillus viridinutans]
MNMTSQSASESLIAILCGLLTLNIYTLLPLFISIPPFLDLRVCHPPVLYRYAPPLPAQLQEDSRPDAPVPRLAIWVLDTVVPSICVRKGFCKK